MRAAAFLLPLSLLFACTDKGGDGGSDDGGADIGADTGDGGTDSGADGGTTPVDADDDGYDDTVDCDDSNPDVNPGADEVCNGIDDDCDTLVDDDDDSVTGQGSWYTDADTDGFGAGEAVLACDQPDGMVADDTDCDDDNVDVNPDATEVCDPDDVDEDCSGAADDADEGVDPATFGSFYTDADTDGFGDVDATAVLACDPPDGTVADNTDCDDGDIDINPAATEVCDPDDVDEDCDGLVDDGDTTVDSSTFSEFWVDGDDDGYGDADATAVLACDAPDGTVADNTDCDDDVFEVNPGATEVCDPDDVDEDCDGLADDADDSVDPGTYDSFYADDDTDGFGDADGRAVRACDAPDGTVADNTDCDDGDGEINPDATEVCDEGDVDEDCDGLADDDDDSVDDSTKTTVYADLDEDGYGDVDDVGTAACDAGDLESLDNSDCDDDDATTYPGAEELDDLLDNDCDDVCDEGFVAAGDLVITEIMPNPSAVDDSLGEYVEITNVSGVDVALCGGWTLTDDGADDHALELTADDPIVLADGEYLVLGRSTDTSVNGGAPVDYAYAGDYNLANGEDEVILSLEDEVIDEVWYDSSTSWGDVYETGASMTLDFDATDATSNDDADNWCTAASVYGDGDLGTPGVDNDGECVSTCGNGELDEGEEYDPAPGPYDNIWVDEDTCRWDFSDVNQLYCNGTCTWAGSSSCDSADADILCKLITGNPDSEATSWTATTALAEHGFSCPSTTYGDVLDVVDRGVSVTVYYYDDSILSTHGSGSVVAYPDCTDP